MAGNGSGAGDGAGLGGTGGFSIGVAPPFSIPPAPSAGSLAPCDSMAPPEVVALLPDGRALVTQPIPNVLQRLVRLWTFSSNELETLFVTGWDETLVEQGLAVADDGQSVVEILDRSHGGPGVRVFDLAARRFHTAEPLAIDGAVVSSDGRFVVDRHLQRFTVQGRLDFDFAPLVAAALSPATTWEPEQRALSRTGKTLAVAARVSPDRQVLVVVRDDGAGPPVTLGVDGVDVDFRRFTLLFSPDERFLLRSGPGSLRVWELATATVVSKADVGISAAAFTADGARLVTTGADGVIERDPDGAHPFVWPIDGERRFALGPGVVLGHRGTSLVVVTRQQTTAEWRHLGRWWPGAVAVTDTASFSIFDHPYGPPRTLPDPRAPRVLARFVANRAGPAATLRVDEQQTEWEGQLAFSPDGQRLAVVFPDSVRIVAGETLAVETTLATEAGAIAWSPDGRFLAVTPNLHYRDAGRPAYQATRAVALWDASSGGLVARYSTAVYPRGIAFDETGRAIRGWGSDMIISHPLPGSTFTTFMPIGDSVSFTIDLAAGAVSPLPAPSFVGSARDLVVEDRGIFRVSNGAALVTFANPFPQRGAFSADLSLVFVESTGTSVGRGDLYALGDGHRVAEGPDVVLASDPLALSRDGRRLAIDQTIYCLQGQ